MVLPNPGQMFTNMLNPSKGWPHMAALDFQAKISANVLYPMVAGQTAHLNSVGELEPGCILKQMGLFMFQGANDLDVNNAGTSYWQPVSPSGRVMCLVAKGAYELETTEFDASLTYAPNDSLNAPVGNGATAYPPSGQLTNAAPGTLYAGDQKAIQGIVSRGKYTNAYGVSVLAFWPVYIPSVI